jgi:hypothetical protein
VGILNRVTIGATIATFCGASALGAQTSSEVKRPQVWDLHGLRAGYCVRFVVEPRAAARKLRTGFVLIRADADSTMHPALRGVIQRQPEFASWTPSNLCFYFTDSVRLGARRVVDKDARIYQMLAVWTLGTEEQKSGARRDIVVDMYASRSSLVRAGGAARVRLREAHSVVHDRTDTPSDIYSVSLERTLLVWRGHPIGDSTRVERPIQESWLITGTRGLWAARLAFKPTWSQPLVGSLTVEGKGDLAEVLKASPIRFVGPLYRGGAAELMLWR